jgi:hypothetical protein
LKKNPEWQGIIEEEDVYLRVEKTFKAVTDILTLLQSNKALDKREVELLWRLVAAPSEVIHSRTGAILLEVPSISRMIGNAIVSADKEEDKSIKNKILGFVRSAKHVDSLEFASRLTFKVIEEIKDT